MPGQRQRLHGAQRTVYLRLQLRIVILPFGRRELAHWRQGRDVAHGSMPTAARYLPQGCADGELVLAQVRVVDACDIQVLVEADVFKV